MTHITIVNNFNKTQLGRANSESDILSIIGDQMISFKSKGVPLDFLKSEDIDPYIKILREIYDDENYDEFYNLYTVSIAD